MTLLLFLTDDGTIRPGALAEELPLIVDCSVAGSDRPLAVIASGMTALNPPETGRRYSTCEVRPYAQLV
jgi:hypothetical protein